MFFFGNQAAEKEMDNQMKWNTNSFSLQIIAGHRRGWEIVGYSGSLNFHGYPFNSMFSFSIFTFNFFFCDSDIFKH